MNLKDNLPRFSYQSLLFFMVILFALIPLSHEIAGAQLYISFGFTLVLLASVYSIANRLHQALIGVLLAIPAIAGRWLDFVDVPINTYLIQFSFTAALHIYVTSVIMNNVFRATIINANVLFGAVCIYFMLGFIWGSGFTLIEILEPGSFGGLPDYALYYPVEQKSDVQWHHLFYFSFITLTTLGYGNIAPLSILASAVASFEAIVGQLYLTILVARLVALYVSTGRKEEQEHLSSKIERKIVKTTKQLEEKLTPSSPSEDN